MIYVILLLGFGAVFILCFELMPDSRLYSKNTDSRLYSRMKGKSSGKWIINKIANVNRKWFNRLTIFENFRKSIQKKLSLAGAQFGWTPDEFLVVKEISAITFFLIFWLVSSNFSLSLFLMIIGFLIPDLWLNEKIERRKRSIVKELPYFIDVLTLSVEAGLDFGAGINKIVQKSKPTPLVEELRQMQEEIRIGMRREDALRNLAKRVDIPEVSSFTSSLIQADNIGSPLGATLRIQSEQMRLSRFLRAEKKAHEAPVKMLFPLIFFIFPVIFIVLFGPVILQLLG